MSLTCVKLYMKESHLRLDKLQVENSLVIRLHLSAITLHQPSVVFPLANTFPFQVLCSPLVCSPFQNTAVVVVQWGSWVACMVELSCGNKGRSRFWQRLELCTALEAGECGQTVPVNIYSLWCSESCAAQRESMYQVFLFGLCYGGTWKLSWCNCKQEMREKKDIYLEELSKPGSASVTPKGM